MSPLILSVNNSLELSNPIYENNINLVWKEAEEHLVHTNFQHFTDHSIKHSERILENASALLKLGNIELNDAEIFILKCAIALHDIGMITDNYIDNKNLLTPDDKLEQIRKEHHIYSYNYIKDNYTKLHLGSTQEFVDIIAEVAKNHRKTDLDKVDKIKPIGSYNIRLKLLSAILRLSDCLDYDYRRVNMERYKDFSMKPKSRALWYCNYYIQAVRIEEHKINIIFRFPEVYENNNIENCIINYIETDIKKQVDEVYNILASNNIWLYHESLDTSKTYDFTLKPMEDDVCDYFTSNLSKNKPENIPTESNSTEQTIESKEEPFNFSNKEKIKQNEMQLTAPDLNEPENIPIESNSTEQTIESKEEPFDFLNKEKFKQKVSQLITSDLKEAIKFINDGISFYQNEKKEDVKEILAECYKLKSEVYREIEGNGNKLLAVFSNIAYSTLKEN
jgi:hypothetical protein